MIIHRWVSVTQWSMLRRKVSRPLMIIAIVLNSLNITSKNSKRLINNWNLNKQNSNANLNISPKPKSIRFILWVILLKQYHQGSEGWVYYLKMCLEWLIQHMKGKSINNSSWRFCMIFEPMSNNHYSHKCSMQLIPHWMG